MVNVRQDIKQAFENCYGLSCKKSDINIIERYFDGMGYEFFTFTIAGKGLVWTYFPTVNCVCIAE